MKFTWPDQIDRLQGRMNRYVKNTISKYNTVTKKRQLRRWLLMVIIVWLVIPAVTVKAEDVTPVTDQSNSTTITLNQSLVAETPKYTVEVRTSPYKDAQAKASAAKKVMVTATAVSTETADPGEATKTAWAQKAAASYNIDWKLLKAVWNIESGGTWFTTRGSSAGARGPCQFMPGTWRAYAQDGNGDGTKNMYDARDCLFASAKLLAVNGANVGNIDRALFSYNHSLAYVAKVKRIMAGING